MNRNIICLALGTAAVPVIAWSVPGADRVIPLVIMGSLVAALIAYYLYAPAAAIIEYAEKSATSSATSNSEGLIVGQWFMYFFFASIFLAHAVPRSALLSQMAAPLGNGLSVMLVSTLLAALATFLTTSFFLRVRGWQALA